MVDHRSYLTSDARRKTEVSLNTLTNEEKQMMTKAKKA